MDNWKLNFWEKTKGFLGAPVSTFNNVEAEALGSALKYFTIWVVIYTILRTIVFYTLERRIFQTLWDLLGFNYAAIYYTVIYRFDPVIFALLGVVGAFVGLFISGSWAHLFVRAFGGRKGYGNTIKAFAYGNTPIFLFGWIPFVGALFSIWALVLDIIGIRQLHEISTGRAVGAVLLSIVALVIIGVLIGLFVVLFVVILAAG
jgi:hypothetical protein